ncbi:arginine--tRNA ligase [Streptomyces sp. DSM 44917]|uniref:Arginine--tRNA ligase n=1 Tax=Streptomyces boetiae TaxID=3075541 RepID=A0ABU2LDI1_9ACTN|nr:arginine--tRNA ligase [Streptomyces sp. DSM 44917]MDT0309633.1 arginine--tRNA ligase [Streptomyces sp. DSM 44917]
MTGVPSLSTVIDQRLAAAIADALPEAAGADPLLRRSDRADFQANGLLALAKRLKGNPRELAGRVAAGVESGAGAEGGESPIREVEVSGPGFLNITVTDAALLRTLAARAADDRLGVPFAAHPGTMIVEYSQPNVAKEMHVGHLRSTVIGDALVRIMEFRGEKVIKRNHVGDWGTQFGMLIQYLIEHPHELDHEGAEGAEAAGGEAETGGESGSAAMSRLNRLYRASRELFDADPEFKERARRRVVDLQAGDGRTLALWQRIVDESKLYFNAVYDRLGVLLTDEDLVGESAYNDDLADLSAELEESGVAVRSDGALCVFFDDIKGPDDKPVPLIVRKADGGFGYAATDLAAIRNRIGTLHADTMLYIVDARQALHFRMVFETARRAGWLPEGVAHHLPFGTVLGKDGKPFKTRSGETVRLMDLLDEAVARARAVVEEKATGLTEAEVAERATEVGIGAVKYADLSTSRTRDYVFDLDRMVSLNGNTSVYLQYAYARIRSILRRAEGEGAHAEARLELPLAPAERALALHLDAFAETLQDVADAYEPHRLAAYLYALASHVTAFYDQCPVLRAPDEATRANRLFLCELAGRTLSQGMALLGIKTPERL